jgi:hypothetical protein
MAKNKKNLEDEPEIKQWQEATLIETFNLNRIREYQTPLMKEWLTVENPILNVVEQVIFDHKLKQVGVKRI